MSGTRVALESFVVTVARDCRDSRAAGHSEPRLGITVSRKVGNAVIRNRVKRRVREWFRHSRSALPPRADVIVVARHSARAMSARETARVLDAAALDSRVGVDGRAAVRVR
ncbi:MAG TPA: ribonuclease P protein component [Myxococcota bacterium]|nr:ribonuclease P protein component [Myxococcota bacterium]